MMLIIAGVLMMQAMVREPGNYHPPHPTRREMDRVIGGCGGDPHRYGYEKGHRVLTLTGDPALERIDLCVAECAQVFGVIPLQPMRIP